MQPETVYDAVEDIRARILRTVEQISALHPAMLEADEQAGVGEAMQGMRRTSLVDVTGHIPCRMVAAEFEDDEPAAQQKPLADWERELLARQWVNEHGDEETRWLVAHLSEAVAERDVIWDLRDQLETAWKLADRRGEEIGALKRKVADLVAERREDKATIRNLAAEGARLRMRLRGGTS